jgi:hypothetical protein
MSRHCHHDTQQAYDRDIARHLSYESFGREKVSEAEITPEAKPVRLTESEEESPVDNSTVAQ